MRNDSGGWRPILEGAARDRALDAVREVASAVGAIPAGNLRWDASLAGGGAGIAVFLAYLAKADPGRGHDEAARRFVDRAIDAVSAAPTPALYGGFTGVAWAVEHLRGRLLDPDGEDSNEAIDDILTTLMGRPWKGDYDLISGLAGFGVYALERQDRPQGAELAVRIVDRLEARSERSAEGVTWHTPPELLPPWQRELCPGGYYNLGLAHGVPGVIGFLAGACATKAPPPKARAMLDGAVSWLLAQKRAPEAESVFDSWKAPGAPERGSRTAWCYGDPGAAAALLLAGRTRDAVDIAARSAARPADKAGIVDAGLCHGAAGIAHLFNRMFQATADDRLRKAALFWFTRTLELRRPGEGIAGWKSWRGEREKTWEDDPGLLTGSTGIAMALLAAATPVEPSWDRMLMLSL